MNFLKNFNNFNSNKINQKYSQSIIFICIQFQPQFIAMENSENKSIILTGTSNLAKQRNCYPLPKSY